MTRYHRVVGVADRIVWEARRFTLRARGHIIGLSDALADLFRPTPRFDAATRVALGQVIEAAGPLLASVSGFERRLAEPVRIPLKYCDELVAALPGMGGPVQGTVAPAVAQSTAPRGIDMPGVAMVPVTHFKFSVSTSVPEIDAALSRKEAELAAKEEELRLFQRQTERELLEYESRKSEILLGRIYVALKELAIKEEVSVIIDKRSILFGQKAVDLTGKLLKKLEDTGI